LSKIAAALVKLAQAQETLLAEAARELGLSSLQARILLALATNPGPGVRALARELALTPATLSVSVATLAKKGLLLRESGTGRTQVLVLSQAGQAAAAVLSGYDQSLEAAIDSFSPEEQGKALEFLLNLIAGLKAQGVITIDRSCATCRFFRPDAHPGQPSPHHCALMDLPLAREELRVSCPEHEAA
jgi:DNA-binding MarR family transcriptional regulator